MLGSVSLASRHLLSAVNRFRHSKVKPSTIILEAAPAALTQHTTGCALWHGSRGIHLVELGGGAVQCHPGMKSLRVGSLVPRGCCGPVCVIKARSRATKLC